MADPEVEKQNAVKRKLVSESVVMKKSDASCLRNESILAVPASSTSSPQSTSAALSSASDGSPTCQPQKAQTGIRVQGSSRATTTTKPTVVTSLTVRNGGPTCQPQKAQTGIRVQGSSRASTTTKPTVVTSLTKVDLSHDDNAALGDEQKKNAMADPEVEGQNAVKRKLVSESVVMKKSKGLKNEQDDAMSDDDMPLSTLLNGKRAGSSTRTGVKRPPQVESTQSGLRQSSRVRMPVVRFAVQCGAPPKKKVKVDDKKPESKEAATIRIRRLEAALEKARAAIEATSGKNAAKISEA